MELRYLESAIDDLYKILDFIAIDSPGRALLYVEKLRSKIEILKVFPNLGVTCQSKNIDEDCRVMIFESYLIFYTIRSDTIIVRNVINSAVEYTDK